MRYNDSNSLKVETNTSAPFWVFSWMTWIVFMILYYGTGTIADWPVFWIWFPFWLPFAVFGAMLLFLFIFAAIVTIVDRY